MQARQFLRVGGFLLFFTSSVSAQPIPFDYWYGKIVSQQRISVTDSRSSSGTSEMVLDYYLGVRNIASADFIRLVRVVDYRLPPRYTTYFRRPGLVGQVRTGQNSRLLVNYLDWDEYSKFEVTASELTWGSSRSFIGDWSLIGQSREPVFDDRSALYFYLKGLLATPRVTLTRSDLRLKYADRATDYNYVNCCSPWKYEEEWGGQAREGVVGSQLRYGLVGGIELGLSVSAARTSEPSRYSRWSFPLDIGADGLDSAFSNGRTAEKVCDWVYAGSAVILPKANLMVSLRPSYSRGSRRESYDDYDTTFGSTANYRHDASDTFTEGFGVVVEGFWVTPAVKVPYRRFLDNWSGYYSDQLPGGSIEWHWSMACGRRLYDYEYYSNDSNEPPERRVYATRSDSVRLAVKGSLHLSEKCRVQIEGGVLRHQSRDRHRPSSSRSNSQLAGATLTAEYSSYQWTGESRKEISWDGVSTIDYVLGPLLQPGDYRLSLLVRPPHADGSWIATDGSLFRLTHTESDRLWNAAFAASYGASTKTEAGFVLEFRRLKAVHLANYDELRSLDWRLLGQVKWQPTGKLRLKFALDEQLRESVITGYLDGTQLHRGYNYHSWAMSVGVDLFL